MQPRFPAFALALASLLALVLPFACGDGAGGGGAAATGSLVIGVLTDLRPGVDIGSLHVVMRSAGKTIDERTYAAGAKYPLVFPVELPFQDLPGGTAVEAQIEAFGQTNTQTPLVRRTATTEILAGQSLLLRVALDARCVVIPGGTAPTCAAPETCVAGACQDDHIDPHKLKPYTPGWYEGSNDPCKPASAGAPVVLVGEGQGDYLPTTDGDTAQVEAGPQGGHHIWVALRAKNLTQSGSVTNVTGHFPDLGYDVGPYAVIFTLEPDEGGYCKLYGLRFQLDADHPIEEMLGHPLDVTVKVTDADGDVGTGTRSVVLSKDFIQ
jgi:hypothetical protein